MAMALSHAAGSPLRPPCLSQGSARLYTISAWMTCRFVSAIAKNASGSKMTIASAPPPVPQAFTLLIRSQANARPVMNKITNINR